MMQMEKKTTRTRLQLDKHLAKKCKCSLVYTRQIIRGSTIPTKGKGLAVLREVQRIYEEPITKAEWEN